MSRDSNPPLLARQRQERILSWVAEHGAIRVAEIVQTLGVSEMTARRDITELVDRGLVDRVHGGAVALDPVTVEPTFESKSIRLVSEKARIAAAAVKRVRPGDAVALTGGTTTLEVARALVEHPDFSSLTIVTNSLPAAQLLQEAVSGARAEKRAHPTIMLSGGERTPSDALVGLLAVEAFQRLRLDWVFAGAHGYDAELGLMTPNLQEAATNTAMIAAARSVVAVLDHTKWSVPGLRSFCPPERIMAVITDAEPEPAIATALAEADIDVVVGV